MAKFDFEELKRTLSTFAERRSLHEQRHSSAYTQGSRGNTFRRSLGKSAQCGMQLIVLAMRSTPWTNLAEGSYSRPLLCLP